MRNNKMQKYAILMVLMGLFAACQSQPQPVKKVASPTVPARNTVPVVPLAVMQSRDGIQDIRWTVTYIQHRKAMFFNQTPSLLLQSNHNRVLGHTGCNALYGSYQIDVAKQSLKLNTHAGHQACDNALAQEATLMDVLSRVAFFSLQRNSIILYDADRQILLQAQR
ncbi:MAG: META domain-containing protein [Acinetobacter sp.]|nr:MAG: META domain-containing protein [Acinetobacter sp.]